MSCTWHDYLSLVNEFQQLLHFWGLTSFALVEVVESLIRSTLISTFSSFAFIFRWLLYVTENSALVRIYSLLSYIRIFIVLHHYTYFCYTRNVKLPSISSKPKIIIKNKTVVQSLIVQSSSSVALQRVDPATRHLRGSHGLRPVSQSTRLRGRWNTVCS